MVSVDCPGDYGVGPDIQERSCVREGYTTVGCRGITCEECWSQEFEAEEKASKGDE